MTTTWTMTTTGGTHPAPEALYIDDSLIDSFIDWSQKKGNSRDWVAAQRRHLGWWQEKLTGRDLRSLSLLDLKQALHGAPSERHRIEVIKALMSWLRSEGKLHRRDDATLDLKVPPARPAQLTETKVVPADHVDKVLAMLTGHWRDILLLLSGTGWHMSEAHRFSSTGRIVGNVLAVVHKSGDAHRTRVSDEVLAAAVRLKEHGSFSIVAAYEELKLACDNAKVPRFTFGKMRHTVATAAVDAGASMQEVSTFLGHKTLATTKKFYATHSTPGKVTTLR